MVILGRGGAGKSVMAGQLGELTGLPVIDLDAEFWNARLEPLPAKEWRRRQEALADVAMWIMDGDLGPYDQLEPRLRRADTVVLLDMPLWLCAWRTWRRGHGRRDHWLWTIRWRRLSRPHLMAAISDLGPTAAVVVLNGRRSVRRWLASRRQ